MRFVEGAAANAIEALQKKHEEEERRLARAAKYGIETKETIDLKRQMRAVKFGINQQQESHGSSGRDEHVRRVTQKGDEKAQQRAVRFGLVSDSMGGAITVVSSHNSEAEEKLKARSERFGGVAAATNSSAEDGDKRKIRLARFGGAAAENGSGRKIINTAQEANKRF